MHNIATFIAQDPYFQATAIIVAVVALLRAAWKTSKKIWGFLQDVVVIGLKKAVAERRERNYKIAQECSKDAVLLISGLFYSLFWIIAYAFFIPLYAFIFYDLTINDSPLFPRSNSLAYQMMLSLCFLAVLVLFWRIIDHLLWIRWLTRRVYRLRREDRAGSDSDLTR